MMSTMEKFLYQRWWVKMMDTSIVELHEELIKKKTTSDELVKESITKSHTKKAVIKDTGIYCNGMSCEISRLLQKGGVPTHFIEQISDTEQLCWKSQVIPMEVIVRNVIAGSMAQRLGLEEGIVPKEPVYDLCYK